MKKGRIILGALAVVATVGSAFALNSHRGAAANLYTSGICDINHKVACSTSDQNMGTCAISVPLYTVATGTCRLYTGQKFLAPAE